jgi:outer membrane receptor protein involved in Fe transport
MSRPYKKIKAYLSAGSSLYGIAALTAAVPTVAAANATSFEEIVVTATHRQASVQEIPFSITALSGQSIEKMGADALKDFAVRIAGLEVASFSPGLNRVTIRGISTQTGESSTGFYIDEMPVTADPVAQPDVRTFDINRVEVLRGPQGTLFGEASLGGTIRIITNKPDATKFAAAFQGTLSNTRHGGWNHGANAMVNVPLAENKLALRIVASERKNEGYIDNIQLGQKDVNDERAIDARASLAWTPNEDLTITTTFQYMENETESEFTSNEDYEQVKFTSEPRDDNSYRGNLTVEYEFPWANFISSTSYFERDTLRNIDQTGPATGLIPPGITVAQVFDINYEIFAQEARLVSTHGGPLDWLVGIFYKDSKRRTISSTVTNPDLGPLLEGDSDLRFKQWALFGELTYHVTDRLHAVAGLRYFEESDRFSILSFGALTGPGINNTTKANADLFTPRFSLTYDISKGAMIYATASRGFRTGGANPTKPIFDLLGIPLPETYDPDTLWNYEIGAKIEAFNQRLTINGSAYYMDWKDIQLPASAAGVFNGTFNAGSATSKGVELELMLRPTDHLTLTAAGNYTDATLDETVSVTTPFGDVPVAIDGNELPLVPKWKLSFSGEYIQPLDETWQGVIRASASFVPKRYNFADNNPAERLNAYQLVDVQVGVESERYDILLFADNLTNEVVEYAFLGDPSLPLERFFAVGRPRTIGLTVRGRF